ncbi:MAG TPA: hypothetical protein VF815_06660 [Myxococcaceae bacterium]|jgi:hypothetical protein
MEWRWLRAWTLLLNLTVGSAALACPDCPTAQVVRGTVVGEGFWGYLAMAVVPFLLIGALSALLYRVGLPRRELKP